MFLFSTASGEKNGTTESSEKSSFTTSQTGEHVCWWNNLPPSSLNVFYQHIPESIDGPHAGQLLLLYDAGSSRLSHAHKQKASPHFPAPGCLLPRVINYANDLCWACRSYSSHSNAAAARMCTGGSVHYRACALCELCTPAAGRLDLSMYKVCLNAVASLKGQ